MRVEEATTVYKLDYTPGNIESMKGALNEYVRLLKEGESFNNRYIVTHFYSTLDQLSITYFKDHPKIIKAIEGHEYYNEKDLTTSLTGETIFFAHALMHEEMKEDCFKACEAMVEHARSINDSSEMWITCEEPFGIGPLSMLAHVYPEYGYLLAGFLVPYWDDEHMPYALFSLGYWSDQLGLDANTLKAYCYCDNQRARQMMLGYDLWDGGYSEGTQIESKFDLLSYLREDEGHYHHFVKVMAERYQNQPWIQEDDEDNPFKQRVFEILYLHHPYDIWEEDIDEFLTKTFISSPADEAIPRMLKELEAIVGESIHVEKTPEVARTSRPIERSQVAMWKDLIHASFSNGQALWNYVETGHGEDELLLVTEIDFAGIAKKEKLAIHQLFEDVTGYSPLYEDLDDLLKPYMSECSLVDNSFDGKVAKGRILRLYDIVHRAFGSHLTPGHLIWLLTDKFDCISLAELHKRYKVKWEESFKKSLDKIRRIDALDSNCLQDFQRFYELVTQEREKALAYFKPFFKVDEEIDLTRRVVFDESYNSRHLLVYAVYILINDRQANISDQLTDLAKKFTERYFGECIINTMSQDGYWPQVVEAMILKDKSFDNEYQINYQRETMEKYEKWLPFEDFLLHGVFNHYYGNRGFEEALAYYKEHLVREDKSISALQEAYSIFSHSDDVLLMINMLYWSLQIEDLSTYSIAQRALRIWFNVAPQFVVSKLFHLEPYIDDLSQINAYINELKLLTSYGLPNDIARIQPLVVLAEKLKFDDTEDEKLKATYLKLLRLYVDDADSFHLNGHPLELFLDDYHDAKASIKRGGEWIARKNKQEILMSAHQLLGQEGKTRALLDKLVYDKLQRDLAESFFHLPVFIDHMYQANNQKVNQLAYNIGDDDFEKRVQVLSLFQPTLLSDEAFQQIHAAYKKDWSSSKVYVNEVDEVVEVLYNKPLIDLLYTEAVKGMSTSRHSIEVYQTKDQERKYEAVIKSLAGIDYKAFWLERVTEYINDEVTFDAVKDLIEFSISTYSFLSRERYDVDLDDSILAISPILRNRILNIVAHVDHEKLNMVPFSRLEEYIDVLMRANVDRGKILKFLVYCEEEELIVKYALKANIHEVIHVLTISEKVEIMHLLAKYPQYHPMILAMKKDKSFKIKEAAKTLISRYRIEVEETVKYHLVDFGEYKLYDDEGSFNPVCLLKSDRVAVSKGTFIGIRFTASEPRLAPKVSFHKVKVSYPISHDENDKIQIAEWDQNGYSESSIFAGWQFDENEPIIEGLYTFSVFDPKGVLMVEKAIQVMKK